MIGKYNIKTNVFKKIDVHKKYNVEKKLTFSIDNFFTNEYSVDFFITAVI